MALQNLDYDVMPLFSEFDLLSGISLNYLEMQPSSFIFKVVMNLTHLTLNFTVLCQQYLLEINSSYRILKIFLTIQAVFSVFTISCLSLDILIFIFCFLILSVNSEAFVELYFHIFTRITSIYNVLMVMKSHIEI